MSLKGYKQRYFGRVITIFLDGGWSFTGVLERDLCSKSVMVLNSDGRLLEFPVHKISGVELNANPINIGHPGTLPPPQLDQYPEPAIEESRFPTGVVAKRNTTSRFDQLVEKYTEDSLNGDGQQGSILPNDLLVEAVERDEGDIDLSMSFGGAHGSGVDFGSRWGLQEEEDEENDSE